MLHQFERTVAYYSMFAMKMRPRRSGCHSQNLKLSNYSMEFRPKKISALTSRCINSSAIGRNYSMIIPSPKLIELSISVPGCRRLSGAA